jgi:hypothetical protein
MCWGFASWRGWAVGRMRRAEDETTDEGVNEGVALTIEMLMHRGEEIKIIRRLIRAGLLFTEAHMRVAH